MENPAFPDLPEGYQDGCLCPKCHSKNNSVYDSRWHSDRKIRYRACRNCGNRWKTEEIELKQVQPQDTAYWTVVTSGPFPYWECGSCHRYHTITEPTAKYCPECGKKILGTKWITAVK